MDDVGLGDLDEFFVHVIYTQAILGTGKVTALQYRI